MRHVISVICILFTSLTGYCFDKDKTILAVLKEHSGSVLLRSANNEVISVVGDQNELAKLKVEEASLFNPLQYLSEKILTLRYRGNSFKFIIPKSKIISGNTFVVGDQDTKQATRVSSTVEKSAVTISNFQNLEACIIKEASTESSKKSEEGQVPESENFQYRSGMRLVQVEMESWYEYVTITIEQNSGRLVFFSEAIPRSRVLNSAEISACKALPN